MQELCEHVPWKVSGVKPRKFERPNLHSARNFVSAVLFSDTKQTVISYHDILLSGAISKIKKQDRFCLSQSCIFPEPSINLAKQRTQTTLSRGKIHTIKHVRFSQSIMNSTGNTAGIHNFDEIATTDRPMLLRSSTSEVVISVTCDQGNVSPVLVTV